MGKYIEHNGETHTLAEWAKIMGVSRQAVWGRYKKHGDLASHAHNTGKRGLGKKTVEKLNKGIDKQDNV